MILLGFDIGSSSVKASLVEAESGQCYAIPTMQAGMMNVEEIRDFCLSLGNDVEEKLPFTMFKNGEYCALPTD